MSGDNVQYHQNVLSGFDNGCLLDLRVRLAIEFLKAPNFIHHTKTVDGSLEHDQQATAAAALDLAVELLAQAEARGLVEPLPDDDSINSQTAKQARRIATYQVVQQAHGQRLMQEHQSPVQRVAAGPLVMS